MMKDPALMSAKEFAAMIRLGFTCLGCGSLLEYDAEAGSAARMRVIEHGLCRVCRGSQLRAEREVLC